MSGKRTASLEPLDSVLNQLEKREILDAFQATRHHMTGTAKLLGVSRSRLYRRFETLGIKLEGKGRVGNEQNTPPAPREPLDGLLMEQEKREIMKALGLTNGVRTAAADLLGISRSRLYRRCQALAIHSAVD